MQRHYRQADLSKPSDQDHILNLLNNFSLESPSAEALPMQVQESLIHNLQQHPTTLIFLAEQADVPVGVAVCFLGFSTFASKPLLNLHDFYVLKKCQGQGIGREFLAFLEEEARARGCCRVTLEVYHNNIQAKTLYEKCGFHGSRPQEPEKIVYSLAKPVSFHCPRRHCIQA